MKSGYRFTGYQYGNEAEKTVILRHDVDFSLEKAVRMSMIERRMLRGEMTGAVYFVLLTSDFYNVHSKQSRQYIHEIMKNGGVIGLHFDEAQYEIRNEEEIKRLIIEEADLLSDTIGTKVDVVSMHRPSEKILSADLEIPGIINSYASCFFKQMKYLSDSRRYWREDIDTMIQTSAYPHFHILTHPFWYMDGAEKSLHQTLKEAVLDASIRYYDHLSENFRDLNKELTRAEIESIAKR